jgi:CheY-like chemotaxis protein
VLARFTSEAQNCTLVVDEQSPNRELMLRMLAVEGWKVHEAPNGKVALRMMDEWKPKLILTDVAAPQTDSSEFISALRARPEWRGIPVAVVTAKDLTAEERDRLHGGVENVVDRLSCGQEQLVSRLRGAAISHAKGNQDAESAAD